MSDPNDVTRFFTPTELDANKLPGKEMTFDLKGVWDTVGEVYADKPFEFSMRLLTPSAIQKFSDWMDGKIDDAEMIIGVDVESSDPTMHGKKLVLGRGEAVEVDRLELIQERIDNPSREDVEWLIAEVEKLREEIGNLEERYYHYVEEDD